MSQFFTQDFYTSRRNYDDGSSRLGQKDRLWYDAETNTIRIGDGTPGGRIVGGGTGGASDFRSLLDTPSSYIGQGGRFVKVRTTENGLEFVDVVIFDGNYNNLINTPDLSVYQLASSAFSGSYTDLSNTPSIPASLNDLDGVSITNPQSNELLIYNSTTSSFENKSLNLDGGATNQILVKKSSDPFDYEWEDMIINFDDKVYTKLLDQVDSELLYLGEAEPDSLESAAVWRIQRIIFDDTGAVLEVRFADGGLFDQIWNNRTLLTYA